MSWIITGGNYGPSIDGLIWSVDAGNTKSYSGSGTTWSNLRGGDNATLTNGPTYSSANGGAIVFNGSNNYAVTANTAFNLTGSHTLSAFISPNFSNSLNATKAIISFSNSSGTIRSDFRWVSPALGFYLDMVGATGSLSIRTTTPPSFVANNWLHVCVTFTYGVAGQAYVNGNAVNTTTNTISSTLTGIANFPIYVGFNAINNSFWDGKIAVANLYNKALSAAEVTTEFNFYRARFAL
jgi:hypothetical protein